MVASVLATPHMVIYSLKLIRDGLTNVRIAVLENAPYVADVAMPWEWLDGKRPNTIYVHPLLLVLGDHAQNDLFGDEEDSVINELYRLRL